MDISTARKLLGVNSSSSHEDIKKAYKKMAMKHHPDRGGNEEQFKKCKEAYEYLKQHTQKHSNGVSDDELHDLFNSVFAKRSSRKSAWDHPFSNDDSSYKEFKLDISLDDAFTACSKTVILRGYTPETHCIYIEDGTRDGELLTHLNLKKNDQNVIYNIYAKISVPKDMSVDWTETADGGIVGNITKVIYVSPIKMILGGWEQVEVLNSQKISVRIPAGLETNSLLKIKNHGYWKNRWSSDRGDFLLRVIPKITKLSDIDKVELDNLLVKIQELNSKKDT